VGRRAQPERTDRLNPRRSGRDGARPLLCLRGPDLQDTFGIDASSFPRATTLRDSYFIGGSAAQTIARLRARPDAILVSKETIADYSLNLGDLLRLRVLDHRSSRFPRRPPSTSPASSRSSPRRRATRSWWPT